MLHAKILWAASNDLPSGWPMLRHSHLFYHLLYIRSGNAVFMIDKIAHTVCTGDCLIIPPHIMHEIPAESHSLLDVYEIKFALSDSSIEALLKEKGPVFRGNIANLEQSLPYIIHAWSVNGNSQQEIADTLLSSALLTIQMTLSVIPEQVSTYIDTSPYASLTKRIIEYLESNHSDAFSLDALQNALDYNKRYLCTVFKNDTGITLIDYLNHIRIRHATILFYYHSVPVSIAAQCVGFTTPNHFTRVFKNLVGLTPMQFRDCYNLNKFDISENKRLNTPYLSRYEEMLGVKRLPLEGSIYALRQLGYLSTTSTLSIP